MLIMSKIKKSHLLKVLAASAVIMALMTSCGASSSESKSADVYENNSANYSFDSFDESFQESADVLDNTKSRGISDGKTEVDYEDKIIRSANLVIESSDAQKCYDTLAQYAKQNGGSEIRVSKSSDTYGHYDYINIDADLKIAPEKLNDFIALAEKTDKVISSEVSSDDITQEYYDIKIRLETKKEALNSYYKMLKQAKTIQEALEVQRYIADLTSEIESMEGMLKYYDSKVDLSSIHLSIRQQVKIHAGAEDDFEWDSLSFSDFITLIKNGFLSVVNFLWSLLLWLIIIIAAISPLLLVAGIVFFIIRRYRKKHPKKPKAKKQAQQANTVPNYMPVYYPPMQGNIPPAPPVNDQSAQTVNQPDNEKSDK